MRTVFEARACTVLFRMAKSIPDGVVLLPANVCSVVPWTLLLAAREFEFVDIDPDTLTMSKALLSQRLATTHPPVAAVVFVRTYGACRDATSLFAEIRRLSPNVLILDDRCQARPEPDPDAFDRQSADVVLFATGYSKPVELGFGGFAHLEDDVPYGEHEPERAFARQELEAATRHYKRHIETRTPLYVGEDVGKKRDLANCRWLETGRPDVSWDAYRRLLLERRSEAEARKTRLNAIYRSLIDSPVRLDDIYHGWRFQLRVPKRDALVHAIFAAGRFASTHYFPAATLFGASPCPAAAALGEEIVNLFNDHRVDEEDAQTVGRITRRHVTKAVGAASS